MMRLPDINAGEIMWDMLKSAICKASEELGYTIHSIQGDTLTVLTKNAKSRIPVPDWTSSLGFPCSRLYQSHLTMRSFLEEGGSEVFAQGEKLTLMKGNRSIEQRGSLGKTIPRKMTTIYLLFLNNATLSVSIYTITHRMNTIIFQQMTRFRTSTRALFVHITTMKEKRLCSVAVLTWTNTLRKW
jgi:hypothetical protein